MYAEKAIGENQRQTYRNPVLALEGAALEQIPSEHVRVQMCYVGICGTDVHLVSADEKTGLIKTSAPCLIPDTGRVIGHEGVGRVIGVGACVHYLNIGDIVAFESLLSCGICDVCRWGKPNQCRNAKLMGLQFDGLFSEVVDIPWRLAQNISKFVESESDLKSGACLEPAGVAYVACENLRLCPSDKVVVFGAGPIGAYCAMLCKQLFGVQSVLTVEPLDHRRKLAKKWSSEVYSASEFHEHKSTFDVLIEASGDLKSLTASFKRIEPNGRVCFLARSGQDLYLQSMDHIITNNITLVGSRGHLGGVYERLLPAIKSGRFPILDVVTKELDGLDELLAHLKEPQQIALEDCKVLCRLAK